ncbi:hypothetical protein [Roseomonas indoligenes]|uniref:Uncharacterized protein n=1 Tax=Roseomonas indoligenes TaxID=2820811 RepID=A0A940S376_9PROT|nr:hypothetical protein [Pararoseomonas indoligenes]MBP0491936.1 hypothetical protein [Pararoseomonas indoligenes]
MGKTLHAAGAACLLLAACAPDGGAGQAAADPVYACQMRGAMAEDRVYGPLGQLDIDSASVRSQVTQACLERTRAAGAPTRPQ